MQNKKLIAGIVALLIIILGGVLIYNYVLSEPEAASGPIEAVPLELNTPAPQPTTAPSDPLPTEAAPTEVPPTAAAETATEAPTPTDTPAPTATPVTPILYEISQTDSRVTFTLQEDLAGVRTTVVGTTDQVAGQIAVNVADLTTAQVGVITINARTLLTDNNFRNNAIRNRILNTDQFEFITFTPTQVVGLPASVAAGEAVTFQIVGNLTIRDITNEVTFEVTATATSDTQIAGTATAIVTRSAYELVIPSVPDVANVTDEVQLTIDFVAVSG